MRGLAYKKVSLAKPLTRRPEQRMSPRSSLSEQVSLLDQTEKPSRKRCWQIKIRVDGADGVWSWIVAFANFLVNFIIVGLGRMSGILYVDFMHLFHIDRKTASVPFSIQQAARNLFGPLAGILGQKYGVKAVTIIGGLIGAISATVGYFAMDIFWITLMWGLVFGISTALTTTINQVSIDQHFEKHRATAGGLAFSGGCVGAFFFPVVLEILIADYGMAGTFLVMGAIIFNVVPAAMLLGEPTWSEEKTRPKHHNYNEKAKSEYGTMDSTSELNKSIKSNLDSELDDKNVLFENKKSPFVKIETAANEETLSFRYEINFELLQEHDELVFMLLTMDISEVVDQESIVGDLQMMDKILVIAELQKIYSSMRGKNISKVIQDTSYDVSECDKPKLSQQIRDTISKPIADDSAKTADFENGVTNKSHAELSRRAFISSKLNELYQADESEILSFFPSEIRNLVSNLLLQLRKLYKNFMLFQNTIHLQQSVIEDSTVTIVHKPDVAVTQESVDHAKLVNDNSWRQGKDDDSNTFKEHMKTAIRLHGNPLFLLICLCRAVFMLTFIPIVTIVVDFSMDKGLNKSDGKYIIATLSLGDFLGRLCLGWINDKGLLSLPRYMLVVMIILAVSTASLPFMHSRTSFIIAILVFGILQGSLFVRHPILISKYMKSNEKSIGMGFINLLSGFLGFALPAFIGYFRDNLGSYDNMFFVSGAICAGVGLLWALEPCFVKFYSKLPYEKL